VESGSTVRLWARRQGGPQGAGVGRDAKSREREGSMGGRFLFSPTSGFYLFIYLFILLSWALNVHNTIVPSNFNSFSVVVGEVSHNFSQFQFYFILFYFLMLVRW